MFKMVYYAVMVESPRSNLSERVHADLRDQVLRGEFAPGQALKPQELANRMGVSLAVVREALVRLAGDGLADRSTNRGFAVPTQSAQQWQDLAETRRIVEPATLRLSIMRGDLDWEAGVRAAHHRLARTPQRDSEGVVTTDWSTAHHGFHRALLAGCGNEN